MSPPDRFEEIPERALAIYAHPDDPDISCGGTLARWAAHGCAVHVLLCTDGGKGTNDPSVTPAETAALRSDEVAAAGRVLGIAGHILLGHADGELEEDAELRGELVSAIRSVRPDVVLCPDPTAVFFGQEYVNHRDHRTVGWSALDAVSPAAALPHYFPDAGPPHQVDVVLLSGTLAPDVWVDIEAHIGAKVEAVACHRSQFTDDGSWTRSAVRLQAEEAARQSGLVLAEGFRMLRLGG